MGNPSTLLAALSGLLSGYRTIAEIDRRHGIDPRPSETAIAGIRHALALAGYDADEVEREGEERIAETMQRACAAHAPRPSIPVDEQGV